MTVGMVYSGDNSAPSSIVFRLKSLIWIRRFVEIWSAYFQYQPSSNIGSSKVLAFASKLNMCVAR